MLITHRPNLVVVLGLLVATLVSLGPHMMMLGYRVADAQPPAALLFVCPLHQLEPTAATSSPGSALRLHVKPYRGHRAGAAVQ